MTSNANSDDSSVESSSDGPYYDSTEHELDSEALGHIKSNDPDWGAFYVDFNCDANFNDFSFDPLSIDWEEEKFALSKSRHVKLLEIRDLQQGSEEHHLLCIENQEERIKNAKAFYRAVAANRSCKHLLIEGNITYGLEMKDTVAILRPFIQNNTKLCSLELGDFTLDARTAQILACALSQCAGSLRSFGLKRCENLTERSMEKIVNVLKVKSNIKKLSLDENDINDEAAVVLGDALATLSLKSLSLEGDYRMEYGSISPAGMEAISQGLSQNSTLKSLSFSFFPIGVEGGLFLAEAVSNNSASMLKELNIIRALHSGNIFLSREGWDLFFDLLSNSSLQKLELGGNNITDDAIPSMVACLNSMTSLTTVDLWYCSDVTDYGWTIFFRLLKNNTSLRKCKIDKNECRGWGVIEAMRSTLCDRTSVDSIFSSNHTLCVIEPSYAYSANKLLLKMNENSDKVEVARQKIIKYYFLEDNNLHELGRMDMRLLPRVLEHVDNYEPARLYEIVRFIPSLVHTTEKTNDTRRKRKRMT